MNIHLNAHTLLPQASYSGGAGLDEDTNIQHLKYNIKADSGLEHSLSTARINSTLYSTFQSFVTFMTAEVEHKSKRRNQLNVSRGRYVLSVRGGRYGDRGRRGRGGRSGRDRGNPRQHGPPISSYVDGKTVEGRHYPSEEFQKLSRAQRTKVIELRKK